MSYDFVDARTRDGRKFPICTIIDEASGECWRCALLIVVGGQFYAGESDAGAKHAACEQAKSGLTYLSTASIADHREGTGDAQQGNGGEQTW